MNPEHRMEVCEVIATTLQRRHATMSATTAVTEGALILQELETAGFEVAKLDPGPDEIVSRWGRLAEIPRPLGTWH